MTHGCVELHLHALQHQGTLRVILGPDEQNIFVLCRRKNTHTQGTHKTGTPTPIYWV